MKKQEKYKHNKLVRDRKQHESALSAFEDLAAFLFPLV